MRLLVVTQAADSEDPVLAFFLRWIEELAKCVEHIEVICLKEGKHSLSANVRVHSLGKERGAASRAAYAWRFLSLTWKLRSQYDAVFVHMNEEYILLGGLFWRALGKRVVLWRNHKMGSWRTRVAGLLSNAVLCTSPEAFVARYKNAQIMPMGIDTDSFVPPASPASRGSVLFAGRLDPVKRVETFISALEHLKEDTLHIDLYGSPTEPGSPYAAAIASSAEPYVASGMVSLYPGVSYEKIRDLYQSHAIYVNLTPSGSFDKTIGEAMASGCLVVSSNTVLRDIVHPELLVRDDDAKDVARGVRAALAFTAQERAAEAQRLRAYIEERHSLRALIGQLKREL